MANLVRPALLLSTDMVDLRSMRKHEVFLGLKRDLAMVSTLTLSFFFTYYILFSITSFSSFIKCFSPWQAIQATYKAEETVNYSHRQMKEE